MNTLDAVYGRGTLVRAMREQHPDPEVRRVERQFADIQREYYEYAMMPRKPERHDPLPAHYRNIKV